MGRLSDRHGPRFFMGAGPLIAAAGMLLLLRVDADVDYLGELLPALLVFSLGLSITVAPLTATVLADADERNAGLASGINNAIARVAGLFGIAALGAVVAAQFASALDSELSGARLTPRAQAAVETAKERTLEVVEPAGVPPRERELVAQASEDASLSAFRLGMAISAALVGLGGMIGAIGITNCPREVAAEECPGGQLIGAPVDSARERPHEPEPAAAPAPASSYG
jgi:hypothetical protein